jgi:hypothetical protein
MKELYDETARRLAVMFQKNYEKYVTAGNTDYSAYGPKAV